ncbi:DEAD/DEAH box helicase [Shewanella inventionis]|uniref:DEAD/DEAH box helicase n=1 Tax=Shewanella inventionis TaxID=1738770 RepID=A0ABQ1JSJ8_9GAMM|nr:DEAD/DEAH box helicase [Shewanella inventionis]MCL1159516.1 DEAD/DEAH box helicase [Shewanella inventionis]GGB73509.1 DEAD/DEAH box helicase [Shewanella inventionis]
MEYFSQLTKQAAERAQEASLSVFGISNPSLRSHLKNLLNQPSGKGESLLSSPLFEHTFGWEPAKVSISELKGTLLSKEVITALDHTNNGRYRFNAEYSPFTHQLKSWQMLLNDKPQSVVVTSGTGSGKTECFMVPVIEDLHREIKQTNEPLVGVRALFLYPLNALINSQKERLDAWTKHFGNNMRFCLYNGNTENLKAKVSSAQNLVPNQVLSRELMREKPAPILVTNGTMLEYMMVRQVDAPIIEASKKQKSLRWIVLDEAHTYVGSQAAELALQLRRVLIAFGVEAKDVRFVATSATIAGKDTANQLKKYLAELAGVSQEHVTVIGGQRVIPLLPKLEEKQSNLKDLISIPADEAVKKDDFNLDVSQVRFNALASSKVAKAIRTVFVNSSIPQTLEDINQKVSSLIGEKPFDEQTLLLWIDLLTATKPAPNKEAFLKVRAHYFQRMFNGLFACTDPQCTKKLTSELKNNWPYGYVYSKHRTNCDCESKAPVLEIAFCNECNEPHLLGTDKNGKLTQWQQDAGDEFSLSIENNDDEVENKTQTEAKPVTTSISKIVLSSKQDPLDNQENRFFSPIKIDLKTGELASLSNESTSYFCNSSLQAVCSNCSYKGYNGNTPYRRSILGAPFYVANVVPTILEYCPDHEKQNKSDPGPLELPGRGRKLITFTDSRQGTARMAVKMQQEAEQARLRGAVYQELRDKQMSQPTNPAIKGLTEQLREAEMKQDITLVNIFKNALKAMQQNESTDFKSVVLSWSDMVTALAKKEDFQRAMLAANKYANPELFNDTAGPFKLAETFLLREFIRRPKRYYNLETQGIVKVSYLGLDEIELMPDLWKEHGLNRQDWQDFVKITLDFHVRNNSFFQLEDEIRYWIGFKFSPKKLIKPDSTEQTSIRVQKWPQLTKSNPNRLFKLLIVATKLDESSSLTQDIFNGWLKAAWLAVTSKKNPILKSENSQYYLDRSMLTFSFQEDFWACPITNKLLDTTFKGITPYLPSNYKEINSLCEKVKMPPIWDFDSSAEDEIQGIQTIRRRIADSKEVKSLRNQNLWTDINDRTIEGGFYYRTAEHSAQQSSERLKNYEKLFEQGKVNVLNCSTTMEMGVDIAGISAVVMNNVPPHPANYLQRAGRAGRSKESRALAFTLCKSNPHDTQVFNNPAWPFTTLISAPLVSLNSARLTQRHVNAYLLGKFLTQEVGHTEKEKTSLNLSWFYESDEVSICDRFKANISGQIDLFENDIKRLIKGTVLEGRSIISLIDSTIDSIEKLQKAWLNELHSVEKELSTTQKDGPYAFRLGMELQRHRREYLLRELAAKAFLPGYGFPTDIVNLDNYNIEDFLRDQQGRSKNKIEREDNISRLRGLPSRNLAIAIREYAPGAEMVIDGRVFRSAGVSLNWQNIAVADAKDAQKFDLAWRCVHCGQTGYTSEIQTSDSNLCCTNSHCGQLIKNEDKLRVLQPTGFVTDFYVSPTNNITTQQYIPVQPAWVSVNSSTHPLPNPKIGFMRYGADGSVFNYSAGAHGKGYAMCLSCGRAESLNAQGEFPSNLSPDTPHTPIRGSKKDKADGRHHDCEGSAHIHKDIYLGSQTKTDVLEIILCHPNTHEHLIDTGPNTENRTIALTIAVATRNALASTLGILNSEMGYAIRPTLVNGENILAIQMYDTISGGAGFASSGSNMISEVLSKAYDNLSCNDNCDSICACCLLDADTRHDVNNLNRLLAKNWLTEEFKFSLQIPQSMQLLSQSQHASQSAFEEVQLALNKQARSITLFLSNEPNEWDLAANTFRRKLKQYDNLENELQISLVIPSSVKLDSLEQTLIDDLLLLHAKEINLYHGDPNVSSVGGDHGVIIAQIENNTGVFTLASNCLSLVNPDQNWLQHRDDSYLIKSYQHDKVSINAIDISIWQPTPNITQIAVELTKECNGLLTDFGLHFWQALSDQNDTLKQALNSQNIESIQYSDRYLQNPWSMLMLGELLKPFATVTPRVDIFSLYNRKDKTGSQVGHDWDDKQEMIDMYDKWFELGLKMPVNLNIETYRGNIQHRRELILTFTSGLSFSIRFDQGLGYWKHDLNYHNSKFEFFDVQDQLIQLTKIYDTVCVKNSFDWSTDIYVNQITQ